MARTSITGYQRQYGSNGKSGTPAVFLACIQFSFDVSLASASIGKTLPKGAIPLFVQSLDGNAAADSATVDIGISGTTAGFADELIAGLPGTLIGFGVGTAGTLLNAELLVDTPIFAGVGSVAGTGISSFGVYYIMADNGSA